MAAVFGNKDGLRYFMLDGFVDGLDIPLTPTPMSITGVGGGVQYRAKITGYRDPGTAPNGPLPLGMDTSGLIYGPDAQTSFGVKVSVGLTTTGANAQNGSPMTGTLNLFIRFGEGLSLQNITFWGTARLINPLATVGLDGLPNVLEKISSLNFTDDEMHAADNQEVNQSEGMMMAKVGLSFDYDKGGAIHGYAEVKLDAAGGKITGSGQMDLKIDPSTLEWHLYIGGYDSPEIKVPSFMDPNNEITLMPVSVSANFNDLRVAAKAYF